MIGGIITGSQVSAIQNSGHAPAQPSESAIIANLQPGNYTAVVRGVNNTTGVASLKWTICNNIGDPEGRPYTVRDEHR